MLTAGMQLNRNEASRGASAGDDGPGHSRPLNLGRAVSALLGRLWRSGLGWGPRRTERGCANQQCLKYAQGKARKPAQAMAAAARTRARKRSKHGDLPDLCEEGWA